MGQDKNKPPSALRAVHMGVFPTADSLQEVVDLGKSKLPIEDENELFALLITYHNTLLRQVEIDSQQH